MRIIFECGAIPAAKVCRRRVRALQELRKHLIRIVGSAHGPVRQEELLGR